MDITTVLLACGDVVTLKPHLTRKAYKEIQKKFWKDTPEIRGGKAENAVLNIFNVAEAEDYTVYMMIESIKAADGSDIAPSVDYVENLSTPDYSTLKEAVDIATGTETEEEKKD